jgi:hypothetical protein
MIFTPNAVPYIAEDPIRKLEGGVNAAYRPPRGGRRGGSS